MVMQIPIEGTAKCGMVGAGRFILLDELDKLDEMDRICSFGSCPSFCFSACCNASYYRRKDAEHLKTGF
jgi:hypothetical protein